jgi:hypothetical protein
MSELGSSRQSKGVVLLTLARDATCLPDAMRAAAFDLDTNIATTLKAMAA